MSSKAKLDRKLHKEKPDLAGEHKYGDGGQIALFFLFMIIWIADSFLLHYTDFIAEYISILIRLPIGIAILTVSGYFARAGLNQVFSETGGTSRVIRQGVFARTRHPIYFGTLLFYISLILMTCSLGAAVLWIIIFVFYDFIARYEERLLLQKFGDEYRQYMAEVPRWLPRFSVRNDGAGR